MKRIKKIIRDSSISLGFIAACMFSQGANANANLEFHEVASTVMINSLQTQPANSFLKQLYSRLFFVPVWIDENSVSSFSRELFSQITQDTTLDKMSKLYQDAIQLEQKAQDIYGSNGTLYQKVDLEFKISQLYKGYADYALYGSINWGAFQDRLYNLKAEGIEAGWVTYRPKFGPLSLIETAALSGSLSELFSQSVPKEYHYKELQESLITYLGMEKNGGWPIVPIKGVLKPGESNELVPLLRKRLRISGDYGSCSSKEDNKYDSCLKEAVVHFQKRHGLEDEGVIGPNTIAALNVIVSNGLMNVIQSGTSSLISLRLHSFLMKIERCVCR